jgi:1,4-dihydroxy-2-naphthoyl-CoA hydrolase
MSIWFIKPTLNDLNQLSLNTMVEHLDIKYTDIGKDFLEASMPVDHRTHQPDGVLHGGASVALAETLGSVAGNLCIDRSKYYCVGLEINANHIRSVRDGYVTGITRPIHLGNSTQIWDIRILTEKSKLVSVIRLTLAVLSHKRK